LNFAAEPLGYWQVAEKGTECFESLSANGIFLDHLRPLSVRPERVEGLRESFLAICQIQNRKMPYLRILGLSFSAK